MDQNKEAVAISGDGFFALSESNRLDATTERETRDAEEEQKPARRLRNAARAATATTAATAAGVLDRSCTPRCGIGRVAVVGSGRI